MRLILYRLIFEITRKCNMNCDHCLRGPQENLNIKPTILSKVLSEVDFVSSLTITGGEPSLNPRAFTRIADACQVLNRWPDNFYVVTNGKHYSPAMVKALQRLYDAVPYPDLDPVLKISNDVFHEKVNWWVKEKYEQLPFYFNEPRIDYSQYLVNEGNAKIHGIGRREVRDRVSESLTMEIDDENDTLIIEDDVYINAKGDVLTCCDYSYESQEQFKLGNVLEEPLLTILERCKESPISSVVAEYAGKK